MTPRVWPIWYAGLFRALPLITATLLFSSQLALAQFTQDGPKLVGTGAVGIAQQGWSVALSVDGNTAIVGGVGDNSNAGAAWVYTLSGGVWTQQSKLVANDAVITPPFASSEGWSVALSGDDNTAIVGGPGDNSDIGAAWVYTRSGGVWTQQGSKLVGTGAVGNASQGWSVGMSSDGNTAIVGGSRDNSDIGAAWVFTRSNGVWTQQGNKLVGTGAVGQTPQQGVSVSLSGDGNTAIVGGIGDGGYGPNSYIGAAWVYILSGGAWTQQGSKLVGTGAVGKSIQGASVALSVDGNTAIVGGYGDNLYTGAAWAYTRSGGVWSQQGGKLVGTGAAGAAYQGNSVALSSGGNAAIVGGPADNSNAGAAWVYVLSGGVWTQQGNKLVGTGAVGSAEQGNAVALSGDGNTAMVGGPADNSNAGAAWVFVQPVPSLQVTPTTNIAASGNPGGPFAPSSFQYQLSAAVGSINYSISGFPNWLTPSSTSGVASSGTTVTFTVNANANSLAVGTYGPTTIIFANSGTGQGTQTRTATLTVNPPALLVTPTTNIAGRPIRAEIVPIQTQRHL
jgi:hypothetical protein